jgi:hypothetical protein
VTAQARDSDGAVTRTPPVPVVVMPRGGGDDDDDDDGDDGDDDPRPPSTGPWRLVFEPSLDHEKMVDRYHAEIFSIDRWALVVSRDLGRPPVVRGEITVDLTAPISALPVGRYMIMVRAVDEGTGVRSPGASATFDR